MTFTKVQLCSNALVLLGHTPISSFIEPTAGAKVASNLYDSTFISILCSHRWKFATKKALLARLVDAPQNQYQYQYQLPTDMIMPVTTYPVSTYAIYGDKLYSDSDKVEIDYIYQPTESMLPAYFIKCFEYYLAIQFAISLMDDLNKVDVMSRMYEKESRIARYSDSQSTPQVPIQDDPYIRVRVF